jgi:subtilisin family serine protease
VVAAAMNEKAEDKGIIVVAAAMNDNENNGVSRVYPASYHLHRTEHDLRNIVTVASTFFTNHLSLESNCEDSVHPAAPGCAIYSALHHNDEDHGWLNETSQAAAQVTGALALMIQHQQNREEIKVDLLPLYENLIDRLFKSTESLTQMDVLS